MANGYADCTTITVHADNTVEKMDLHLTGCIESHDGGPLKCGFTKTDEERAADKRAFDAFWCSCGNPGGVVNHVRTYQDIYSCGDCGKALQVG